MRKERRSKISEDALAKGKREGRILRIRTIKPNEDTYMHVGVLRGRGVRGGRTISGPIHRVQGKKITHKKKYI